MYEGGAGSAAGAADWAGGAEGGAGLGAGSGADMSSKRFIARSTSCPVSCVSVVRAAYLECLCGLLGRAPENRLQLPA